MAAAAETATLSEVDEGMAGVEGKEGAFLLGLPTFLDMGGGKFRCSETGHELPERELESYGRSKHCRLALIDANVSNKKAPLNFFKLVASSKSKLICKLTGDTINKSEEHIWKHINGKKFLRKLEQKEEETDREVAKQEKQQKPLKKKSTKGPENCMAEDQPKDGDEETDFWMPPIGERWDMDDGNDRWNSGESSDNAADNSLGSASDDDNKKDVAEEDDLNTNDLKDLNKRTKRMAIEIGPSSKASRKKKKKVDHALQLPQNS